MSFQATCTEISFSAKTGHLTARCSNGEMDSIDLNSIIGLSKDKDLVWNSSGFLPQVRNARIYNYGASVDLEVDTGKWAPNLATLPLHTYIAEQSHHLIFLKHEWLEAEEQRRIEEADAKKRGVWRGLFGRPEKGPDFLGQSRITGRLR